MQQTNQTIQELNSFFDIDDGKTTELSEEAIRSTDHANVIFGTTLADGSTPVVLLPGRNCCKPYITIPEGCYALVQSFGADTLFNGQPIWPSGVHFAPPWKKVSHLITKQAFTFNTPVKGCKTADNVTVTIDVALTVRIMGDVEKGEDPELARTFVYKLTPRGLAQHLTDAQDEAVRRLGRAVNHTEVYGLRSVETQTQVAEAAGLANSEENVGGTVTDAMKRQLNDQFNKYGVQITDVAITNVRLPKEFTKQMQEKTTYASVISEQKMKQENDMQLLAMKEEIETALQKKREEQQEEEAVGIRLCAENQKELDTVVAETKQMVRELQEKEKSEVRLLRTTGDLQIKEIVMQKEAILGKLAAEADATVLQLTAETDKYVRNKQADILIEEAKADAESLRLKSEAEGEAAVKLRAKRMHELELEQVMVYDNLAKNQETVISGNTGDSLLAEMLVAQRQSQILVSVNAKSPLENKFSS